MIKTITRISKILMVFTLTFSSWNITPILASQNSPTLEIHISIDDSINNGQGNGNYEYHYLNELDTLWTSSGLTVGSNADNFVRDNFPEVTALEYSGYVFLGFFVEVVIYEQPANTNVKFVGISAVYRINTVPIANPDTYATLEDTPLTISMPGVLANDVSGDVDPLTAVLVSNTTNGSLSLNADGSFTYTPNANYNGTDSFTYTANDGHVDSNTATVTITVTPVNDVPVAVDDSYTLVKNTTLSIVASGVLGNDSDVDLGTVLTSTKVSDPANGTLILNSNGSFDYTPSVGFDGTVTFKYIANDGTADSNEATVTILVTNNSPVAGTDTYTVDEDGLLKVTNSDVNHLLINDSDPNGDPLTISAGTNPSHGDLTYLGSDGSFSYEPFDDFNGNDSFTYTLSDGTTSVTGTVNITVTPINDAPVAVDDSDFTDEDTAVTTNVLANDSDIDGDVLTISSVTQGSNGTVVINADNTITFTPASDFNGTDSYTYTISDGNGGSDTATVNITINAVNDAPVATDDNYTAAQLVELSIAAPGILGNDTDVEGSSLSAILVDNVSNGTLSLNADGSFTYTSNSGFNGTDHFTYMAYDGTSNSNIATVYISVNNTAPVAVDDEYTTDEDTPLTVLIANSVLANDTDANSDSLFVSAYDTTTTNGGTVSMALDGTFTYTPAANFNGVGLDSDTFTYTVSDGSLTDIAIVEIAVNPINDAPTANDQTVDTAEETALLITLTGSDIDGDSITFAIASQPTNGTLSILNDDQITYTPNTDFVGQDSFTFTTFDGVLSSVAATITINVTNINDAPVAVDDEYSTDEDTPLVVLAVNGVIDNDSDVDGDALEISAYDATSVNGGSVSMNIDGSFTYTPAANFNGLDSFDYSITDGNISASATVEITVNPINDVPVAEGQELTTPEDTALLITLFGEDVDEDELTFLTTAPTNGVLSGTGSAITYTPNANYVGDDQFTYTVSDGVDTSEVATIYITVTPVNDAPVAVAEAYTVVNTASLSIAAAGVLANDTDVEGDSLTAVLNVNVVNGALVLGADGSFTYTPTAGFVGTDTFTYHANDGEDDSNVVTVTITVTAPPAPPVTPPTTPPTTPPVTVTVVPTPTPLAALNTAPVANAGTYSTEFETAISGQASASDADGDALTFALVSSVSNGTLVFNDDGSFTYTPNDGFVGNDSFSFIANDGELDSNTASVVIDVTQGVILVEEPEETPLAALPMDFSWLYWLLGLLPLLLAFIRPNIRYTLITKDGTEKTLRRRLSKPDDDQTVFIVDLNDKNLVDLAKIDVTIYKRLAKHLGNLTVNFVLHGHLVHTVLIPAEQDEEYNTIIEL